MDDARHVGFIKLDMALNFKGVLAHGTSGVARLRNRSRMEALLRSMATFFTERLQGIWVIEQFVPGGGKGAGVAGRDENASSAICDDFRKRGSARLHDWHAAGHGF
jgi:hypothetical protein